MAIRSSLFSRVAALGILGVGVMATSVQANMSEEAIRERLKPVGEVCMAGDPCAGAAPVAAASSGARSGADVYSAACAACHGSGVMGAPKFGSAADWGPRADKGIETLISNALNGLNAMPPRGGNPSLSDEEVANAVKHMVENSQ